MESRRVRPKRAQIGTVEGSVVRVGALREGSVPNPLIGTARPHPTSATPTLPPQPSHALNSERPLLLASVDWPESAGRRLAVAENREAEEHGEIDGVNYRRRRVSAAPQRRVFFRDVKPYEVPERLDALKGPISGVVHLPHTALWAPGGGRVDLDAEGGVGLAYRVMLSEGTAAEQAVVVNRDRLVEVWSDLLLPQRVRDLWEARFPELHGGLRE